MGFKATDDTLAKVAEDEPIFVLRAQDRFAPIVIRTWIGIARWFGTPEEKLARAERCAEMMEDWTGGDIKVPDQGDFMSANDLSMRDRRRERTVALEDHVTALEDQLQAALSRVGELAVEVVELRGALYRAGTNTHVACCEGGDHAPACQEIADALSSPSPVAEALGRVVEAAIELHLALKTGPQEVIDAAFDKLYCRAEALQAAHPTLNPQPPAPEPEKES